MYRVQRPTKSELVPVRSTYHAYQCTGRIVAVSTVSVSLVWIYILVGDPLLWHGMNERQMSNYSTIILNHGDTNRSVGSAAVKSSTTPHAVN